MEKNKERSFAVFRQEAPKVRNFTDRRQSQPPAAQRQCQLYKRRHFVLLARVGGRLCRTRVRSVWDCNKAKLGCLPPTLPQQAPIAQNVCFVNARAHGAHTKAQARLVCPCVVSWHCITSHVALLAVGFAMEGIPSGRSVIFSERSMLRQRSARARRATDGCWGRGVRNSTGSQF